MRTITKFRFKLGKFSAEFVKLVIKERIKEGCLEQPDTGCWIWQGSRFKDGYGIIKISNRSFRCHRKAYEVFNGEIPGGLLVRHVCDTPLCCNPEHLILGTQKDNAQDREIRGRGASARGTNPRIVITFDIYRQVMNSPDIDYKTLAEKLGIKPFHVIRIRSRKFYSRFQKLLEETEQ